MARRDRDFAINFLDPGVETVFASASADPRASRRVCAQTHPKRTILTIPTDSMAANDYGPLLPDDGQT